MDPRHKERLKIVQELYSEEFTPQSKLLPKVKQIISSYDSLDLLIKQHAPKFPIDKISRIDLAILRLAVFELNFEKTQPAKVIINEAVELAKELGSDKSYAFINAVLGKIYDPKT